MYWERKGASHVNICWFVMAFYAQSSKAYPGKDGYLSFVLRWIELPTWKNLDMPENSMFDSCLACLTPPLRKTARVVTIIHEGLSATCERWWHLKHWKSWECCLKDIA